MDVGKMVTRGDRLRHIYIDTPCEGSVLILKEFF